MIASAADIRGIGFTSQRTRDRMVERLGQSGIHDPDVLDVFSRVPRHLFVDDMLQTRAYEDVSLPIGEGQTISRPWVVARMTEILLEEGPVSRVLEVGTGSGYQAAILSGLVDAVFSVERIRVLHERARRRFQSLDYRNVHTRHSDGGWGWGSQGPFDGIVVTAAPERVPLPLFEQLGFGGRLVCPVGTRRGAQSLTVITRTRTGFSERTESDVTFVPFLTGKS